MKSSDVKKIDEPFAKKAIGALVTATGYPAVPQALSSIGIDRTMLRSMARKGDIKAIKVFLKRQCIIGYYTEEVQPVKFFENMEKKKQEMERIKSDNEIKLKVSGKYMTDEARKALENEIDEADKVLKE
jgi:hypothetical protein